MVYDVVHHSPIAEIVHDKLRILRNLMLLLQWVHISLNPDISLTIINDLALHKVVLAGIAACHHLALLVGEYGWGERAIPTLESQDKFYTNMTMGRTGNPNILSSLSFQSRGKCVPCFTSIFSITAVLSNIYFKQMNR